MVKNNVKIRQICMIFIALMPITKLLMLPSQLARYCGHQLYIPALINFAFDLLSLFLILKLSDAYPEKTFFAILEENFGKVTAKIIYFLYGLFFLLKAFTPLLEQKYFVDNTLYEVFPNILAYFPILLLTLYASIKGLKVIGRTAEFAIWFTAISFTIATVFAIGSADFTNLMPIFKNPGYNSIIGSFSTVVWFSESLYMLLFIGHFKEEKHKKLKIMLSYAGTALAVIFFFICFYGVFGPIAPSKLYALSQASMFTTKIVNAGRFDYIAIFMMLFSAVFAVCFPVFAAAKCFERAFGLKKGLIPALVVNIALAIALFFTADKLYNVFNFLAKYLSGYFVLMAYAMPIIFIIVLRRNREKVQN